MNRRRKRRLEEGGKNTVKQHRFFMGCDVSADSHSVLNMCKILHVVN
jgi:hypothetical protein